MIDNLSMIFKNLNTNALLAAIVVFILGGVFALVLRRFDIKDGVVFLTLLILPFAVYGVGSGYISELTAPGGWGAKFREVAAENIEPTALGEEIEDLRVVEKGSLSALDQRRATLIPGKPLAMTLQLGRRNYYNERVIGTYARTLLTFDPKLSVVFVDQDKRFVGSSNGTSVMAAMQGEEQGYELVRAIENADLLRIKDLVGLTTSSVTRGVSNSEALELMLRDGVDSMILINDQNHPTGVVRRDDIVARLLVKLAAG